jgi:hypothetical protein
MNLYPAMVLLALSPCAMDACLAASAPATMTSSDPGESVLVLARAGDRRVESAFMRGAEASMPAAGTAFAARRGPDSAVTSIADVPRNSRPDKGLVALCAVGLVAWQLRRKQAALRAGQLYVTEQSRNAPGAALTHGAPAKNSAVHPGISRAAG